jgi:hypothetical protein
MGDMNNTTAKDLQSIQVSCQQRDEMRRDAMECEIDYLLEVLEDRSLNKDERIMYKEDLRIARRDHAMIVLDIEARARRIAAK